jgi:uncharacterized membrane protein YvlD (DUF360 family)
MRSGRSKFRLRGSDAARLALAWAVSALALGLAAAVLPGLSASTPWAYVAVAGVSGAVGLLLRPVLVEVSARIGWRAILPVAVAGQALILYVAIALVPAMTSDFLSALAASWVVAVVGTLIAWAATAGTDDGLVTFSSGGGAGPPRSSTPRWTACCSSSSTGCPSRCCGGPSSPAPCRRSDDGSHRASTPPTSGSHSCPAPRRPASSESCTGPSTASRPSAGTTARPTGCWWRTVPRMPGSSRPGRVTGVASSRTTGSPCPTSSAATHRVP